MNPFIQISFRQSGVRASLGALLVLVFSLCTLCAAPQPKATAPQPKATTPAKGTITESPKEEAPKDSLGRTTPRGTMMGFLMAARRGNAEVAALYLNSHLRGASVLELAQQLAIVLNQKLPAKLNEVSDSPEGSMSDPLRPDEEVVGVIGTENGNRDITLERVDRGKGQGRVWLFSRKTLEFVPDVYQEVSTPAVERFLPEFLVNTLIADIPLFEYVAIFVGLPLLYFLTGLLNRGLGQLVGFVRRKVLKDANAANPSLLVQPVRLFLVAFTIVWLLSEVGLPLLARHFWTMVATVIFILASVWLLLMLNAWCEARLQRRLRQRRLTGAESVLRLTRRLVDILILFAGFLFTLRHFGVDPTAALAGLGVGGIAVALAAQKTLENVIGGISLIADQALRVGDTLKLDDDVFGVVEEVGLRSTRIRTRDRTVVTVPNGQIATVTIETFSARDKFWFHHYVKLRYDTTAQEILAVNAGVLKLLCDHANVESSSARVRFMRLAAFSLDVEIFAYVSALDMNEFLAIQEALLLNIMETVRASGAEIALPSRTIHVSGDSPVLQGKLANVMSRSDSKPSPTIAQSKSA